MKYIFITLGFIFLIFGIIGILTPIPFGIVFLVLAIVLLVPTVPQSAGFIKALRLRFNIVDRGLGTITRNAPMPYRRILRQTEPEDF